MSRQPLAEAERLVAGALLGAALVRARELDRLADLELATGHHAQAERLAHLAAELREGLA